MSQIPEERSETGKPMVPATPRDVVHIRLGSFVLLFTLAFGALAFVIGAPVLSIVLWAIALFVIIDIVLAVRRQRRMGGSADGLE
ncbi:hypothetical protein AB0K60_09195 [Thermopolyspora sp. NPDC052614]|uniref:hypothetical protein n=1 Tax=Thermopolyspora sp. NPDC052614 TaxID=3155682 RepID=UPI0034295643